MYCTVVDSAKLASVVLVRAPIVSSSGGGGSDLGVELSPKGLPPRMEGGAVPTSDPSMGQAATGVGLEARKRAPKNYDIITNARLTNHDVITGRTIVDITRVRSIILKRRPAQPTALGTWFHIRTYGKRQWELYQLESKQWRQRRQRRQKQQQGKDRRHQGQEQGQRSGGSGESSGATAI